MGPFRMEMPVAEEGCVLEMELSIALSSVFEILDAETAGLVDKSAPGQQMSLEMSRTGGDSSIRPCGGSEVTHERIGTIGEALKRRLLTMLAIRAGQGHIVVGRRHVGGPSVRKGCVGRGFAYRKRVCRRRQCGSCERYRRSERKVRRGTVPVQ